MQPRTSRDGQAPHDTALCLSVVRIYVKGRCGHAKVFAVRDGATLYFATPDNGEQKASRTNRRTYHMIPAVSLTFAWALA